ncbi:hypothetical protein AXK60_22685 [Tsukamurella pseudospumae]|uniref:Uncharacterized protein n=1 Tax=Tsukamurella pseudospumae TaxID=239498 RepID=A0A138AU20_9ACTN|nr:hypothetical protein AXK60_22685 [Tsukamurella pseudospumae]
MDDTDRESEQAGHAAEERVEAASGFLEQEEAAPEPPSSLKSKPMPPMPSTAPAPQPPRASSPVAREAIARILGQEPPSQE